MVSYVQIHEHIIHMWDMYDTHMWETYIHMWEHMWDVQFGIKLDRIHYLQKSKNMLYTYLINDCFTLILLFSVVSLAVYESVCPRIDQELN